MQHATLLEEFIFWTFKYEFPQNVVCFLLNMLPDQDYKVRKVIICAIDSFKLCKCVFNFCWSISGASDTHICNALCTNTPSFGNVS